MNRTDTADTDPKPCTLCINLDRNVMRSRGVGRLDFNFSTLVESASNGCEDCKILHQGISLVLGPTRDLTSSSFRFDYNSVSRHH